jgi:hypothetical protein
MIYEMVCGTLPFGANNPNAVRAQIIYGRDVTPEIAASLLPRPSSFDGISDILPAEFRDDGGGAAPAREPTVQPEVAAGPRPLRIPTAHLDVAPIGRPRAPGNVARAAAALLCGALALLGVMHWF